MSLYQESTVAAQINSIYIKHGGHQGKENECSGLTKRKSAA